MIFVDSNIPMYVAGREHPNRGPSLRLLERARAGEIRICSSTEVLQEILYRYTSIERRELGYRVYDLFVALCPVVFSVTLADTDRAKELLTRTHGPSVRDAVHAAVMLNNDVEEIATFDRGFDSIDGVKRVDLP
jgi:predicted nucleic acid-binding protein